MQVDGLRELGFSQGEIRVYESLLELGPAPLNTIHEKVGIERRNIYDILNKLIERGVVSYVQENGKRYFQVVAPKKLVSYIDERETELEKIRDKITSQLSMLDAAVAASKPSIAAEVFRGVEGMKAVWEQTLEHSESLWIGSGNYVPSKYPHYYASFTKRRLAAKNKRYHLFRGEFKQVFKRSPLEYVRWLPKELSASPMVICIYGNKVANMMLGNELFVFVIDSKDVAENYKTYFWYLWNNVAKK